MINWRKQPYKTAKEFTGGDKKKAIEVIELVKALHTIDNIELSTEKYNYGK